MFVGSGNWPMGLHCMSIMYGTAFETQLRRRGDAMTVGRALITTLPSAVKPAGCGKRQKSRSQDSSVFYLVGVSVSSCCSSHYYLVFRSIHSKGIASAAAAFGIADENAAFDKRQNVAQ